MEKMVGGGLGVLFCRDLLAGGGIQSNGKEAAPGNGKDAPRLTPRH